MRVIWKCCYGPACKNYIEERETDDLFLVIDLSPETCLDRKTAPPSFSLSSPRTGACMRCDLPRREYLKFLQALDSAGLAIVDRLEITPQEYEVPLHAIAKVYRFGNIYTIVVRGEWVSVLNGATKTLHPVIPHTRRWDDIRRNLVKSLSLSLTSC